MVLHGGHAREMIEINNDAEGVGRERRNYELLELSQMTRVSESLLRLEAKRGNVKTIRIGKRIVVPFSEVQRLMGEAD
jgi:hypothetical protein